MQSRHLLIVCVLAAFACKAKRDKAGYEAVRAVGAKDEAAKDEAAKDEDAKDEDAKDEGTRDDKADDQTRGDKVKGGKAANAWLLAVDESAAIDPRASALMRWVVPLTRGGQLECSATAIGAHALLTAAHCVDGEHPPGPKIDGRIASIEALDRRSCGHGSCADPFPVRQYEHFHRDVATLWVDEPRATDEPPGLAEVRGSLPGAFMLSARTGRAHAVCRAYATGDVGEARGFIEPGDSGSAVLAFRGDGSPSILGVVSHRYEADGRWYFAMIANPLPWPAAATGGPPSVISLDGADFGAIEDCTR